MDYDRTGSLPLNAKRLSVFAFLVLLTMTDLDLESLYSWFEVSGNTPTRITLPSDKGYQAIVAVLGSNT